MNKKNIKWLFDTDQGNWWLLIIVYILAVTVSMILVARSVYGPTHFDDETEYWQFAQFLVAGQLNKVFTSALIIPPFYSLSIAPAFFLPKNIIYPAVLLLDSLYLTSIIFPTYLILKKLTSNNRLSVIGTIVLLFQPLFFINAQLTLSENVYLPLFMWTFLFSLTSVSPNRKDDAAEKPRWSESLILGLLIAICYLTRYISLTIIPVFLLIWWIRPFAGEKKLLFSKEKLIHLCIMVTEIVVLIVAWILWGRYFNLPVSQVTGFEVTAPAIPAQLTLARLALWTAFYVTAAILTAGPVFGLLVAGIFNFDFKNWRQSQYRWFIGMILLTGATLFTSIYHSWEAPYNYPHPFKIQWRYMMIFSVLFLITAFVVLSKYKYREQSTNKQLLVLFVSVAGLIASYLFLSKKQNMMFMTTGEEIIFGFGNELLFIVLVIALQFLILTPWKKLSTYGTVALSIGFCVIYLAMFPGIYKTLWTKQVIVNYPITMVLDKINAENGPIDFNTHFTIIYNPKNKSSSYRKAPVAFNVRGYSDTDFIDGDAAQSYYTDDDSQFLIIKMDQAKKTYIVYKNAPNIKNATKLDYGFSIAEVNQ